MRMKKYLMTTIAVVTMGAAFTSCSHNFDVYNSEDEKVEKEKYSAELVQAEYEALFEQTFGKPADDQDWGFGDDNASTRAFTRAFTRLIQPSFDFPDDADASKFLADVPEGVNSYAAECVANNQTDGYGAGTSYVDPTWTGQVNIWGAWDGSKSSGGTLYIKGENDFTNRKFYVAANTEIYLVKNAVLKLSSSNASDLQGGCNFYLADGAKIITDAELVLNNGLHIYNHGTIEANKLHANSNSVLYNKGTVTVDTRISVENDFSVIVNDGTITAADLNTAGSGKFENNGSVTISGTTFVNSNSNTWVNNGQYHTGNFIYYAASDEVINNCKLTVDEDFGINLSDNPGNGNFKMDAGSSVVTKNFYGGGNWSGTYAGTWCNAQGGPFYIYMGAGSVFKVTETATMNASKENYGIYGPTDGSSYDGVSYAVFEAKNVVMGKENQGFEVTYGGNLAVVAESHFAQGNDGQEDHPFIDFKGSNAKIYAPVFESGKPNITIEETECNPGFEGDETLTEVRVICEDLFANSGSDFDFNDLVFDVVFGDNAKIIIRAAGGTLPIYINEIEIHAYMGYATLNEKGQLPMLNTGAAAKGLYGFDDAGTKEINLGIAINERKEIPKKITIKVEKDGEFYTLQNNEKAASMVCVGTDFDPWMGEREKLKEAYPKFESFVKTKKPAWNQWYK
jgi:hypothetical protein